MRPATTPHHLSLVTSADGRGTSHAADPAPASRATAAEVSAADLSLLASLFLLNLVPVVGELARAGRWSPGIVGFAAAAAMLTGRELWSELRALARARG